jgi:hypothetical protein
MRAIPVRRALALSLALAFSIPAAAQGSARVRSPSDARDPDWFATAPSLARDYRCAENRIIVPFRVLNLRATYHVMAWVKDHPELESIEAFVFDDDRIQTILTRRDGTQIDVLTPALAAVLDTGKRRERREGTASFRVESGGKDAFLSVAVSGGPRIELRYRGQGLPDASHAGMTDPGLHDPAGGLPAFYRAKSSVSGPRSKVTIDGKEYAVPIDDEISKPPFFTAYSAFLTVGFHAAIVGTYPEGDLLSIGSDLRFRDRLTEGEVRLASGIGDGAGGPLPVAEVAAIVYSSPSLGSSDRPCELRFNPPLANPLALAEGSRAESRFALSFGPGAEAEVYGTVTVERTGDDAVITLAPAYPRWARDARAIRYRVDLVRGICLAEMERKAN